VNGPLQSSMFVDNELASGVAALLGRTRHRAGAVRLSMR
jgi:hypothetical protein